MHRSVLRGIVLILIAIAVIAALFLLPRPKPESKPKHAVNLDPWVLVNYDPDEKYGTYLGNGFISTRIMGDGVGSQGGRPLPCYMAGFYGDEKLLAIPTWSDLRLSDGKARFVIDKDADYKQTLDMRTAILTTEATWRAGRKTLTGKIEVIVSRAMPNVGLVIATLTPDFSGELHAEAYWDEVAWHNGKQVWGDPTHSSYHAELHTSKFESYVGLTGCLIPLTSDEAPSKLYFQKVDLAVKQGEPIELCSYNVIVNGKGVSAPVPDTGSDIERVLDESLGVITSLDRLNSGAVQSKAGWRRSISKLIADHKAAWAKLWERDIVIEGSRKDQQAIHTCMFNILQSVREGSQWSIPPMGLSNAAFSGHVFWDADLWMFPALVLQHPELAKAIVDYRYNTLPGALANAKASGFVGAEYAWESGYSGREDTPPGLVYRYERHINGDVALCQWQYFLATGDVEWLRTRGYPVIKATADYWVSRVKLNSAKGRYEILQVVPPDENADLVNNNAYTNIIAKMNLEIAVEAAAAVGAAPNAKWANVAARMYIPFDEKNRRFIAFDGYKGFDAKQADSELIAYPLQYKIAGQDMTEIYRNTYDFYAPKVMPNGPAMTSSAHAVILARLGDSSGAYSEFVKSYEKYLRGPFGMFNEKRSVHVENMCFLTGAAGPIQATLFGLAGARMEYFGSPELTWSPCLPKQWKSLKITGVQWRGKSFDVTVKPGNKVELVKK